MNTTRDDIFEIEGLKNDGPLKLSLIIFFLFFLASFVCGSKKFFICWTIHSIYKITTCAHLVGYCPFLVLFFKSFSLFPLYSKGWIYFKDFDICNLSLETKIHNAGTKKKHNVQLNLNIK